MECTSAIAQWFPGRPAVIAAEQRARQANGSPGPFGLATLGALNDNLRRPTAVPGAPAGPPASNG